MKQNSINHQGKNYYFYSMIFQLKYIKNSLQLINLKGQQHENFFELRLWGERVDRNHQPHLGFTLSWSAVQMLQYFKCLSSLSKTCLVTFINWCAPLTNCACWCCSQLTTSVLLLQSAHLLCCCCSPHTNTVLLLQSAH